MGNRQSRVDPRDGDTVAPVTPDAAAQALGSHQAHPEERRNSGSNGYTNPLARVAVNFFYRISEVFSSKSPTRRKRSSGRSSHFRRSQSFPRTDRRDSTRSRSPLTPRLSLKVANGQTEADALRTEHPKLGIEMAEIDTGPELGVEADSLLTTNDASERLSIMSITKTVKEADAYYPYIDDSRTVQWIKKNKVVFVMRGLPGSGKSHLASRIASTYGPAGDVVTCSADDYFDDGNGGYDFDQSRLIDAHEASQDKCRQAVESGKPFVIVDNTNVQYWEMKSYFQIARSKGYHVVICEPKTSWRLDPKVLAKKNKHNVSRDVLQKKARQFQTLMHVRPIYFGWFLNSTDSEEVTSLCRDVMRRASEACEQFRDEFGPDPSSGFNRDAVTNKTSLHCTAKYCVGKKGDDVKHYLKRASEEAGTVTPLAVSGFVVSGRTLGAKVELTEGQLKVYQNDDGALKERSRGDKAHLTLGTKSSEVKPMETGMDTLRSLDGTSSQVAVTDDGTLWRHPDGVYTLKLTVAWNCDALFTGYY